MSEALTEIEKQTFGDRVAPEMRSEWMFAYDSGEDYPVCPIKLFGDVSTWEGDYKWSSKARSEYNDSLPMSVKAKWKKKR